MGQDKRMDMGPMGDYNGMMGKGHGPRHQLHKDPPIDRGPYYDKVGPGRGGALWAAVRPGQRVDVIDDVDA